MRLYFPLIKSLQTGLLLVTGLAGYMSVRGSIHHPFTVIALFGSLFLFISGSTILNMWYDREIDAKMENTRLRPGLGFLTTAAGPFRWAGCPGSRQHHPTFRTPQFWLVQVRLALHAAGKCCDDPNCKHNHTTTK